MESHGVSLSTWLIVAGVIVYLLVLPGVMLEWERRRGLRQTDSDD